MSPLTHEWIRKAEGDLHTAERELAAEHHPNYDAACFHAQQCAEKYLKGLLQEKLIRFRKTHDLVELLGLANEIDPSLGELKEGLGFLTGFAVDTRYPGPFTERPEAERAVEAARALRGAVRRLLGLTE
jgi:HEPN domain-containing protein